MSHQSYIRSFRDRQSDRRSYSHSRMMSRSRMAELDYDCGSQVPLTVPSGPPVRIWDSPLAAIWLCAPHNRSELRDNIWPYRANLINCLLTPPGTRCPWGRLHWLTDSYAASPPALFSARKCLQSWKDHCGSRTVTALNWRTLWWGFKCHCWTSVFDIASSFSLLDVIFSEIAAGISPIISPPEAVLFQNNSVELLKSR